MADGLNQEMPTVIKRFEQLWFGVLLITAVNVLIAFNHAPVAAAEALPLGDMFGVAVFVLLAALIIWLVTSVSRRQKTWAKWVIVALFGAGAAGHVSNPAFAFQDGQLAGVLTWTSIVLQAIAVSLLFTPAATGWLSTGSTTPPVATAPMPKSFNSIAVVSVAAVAGLAGAALAFKSFQSSIPSCGSEVVATTLRDIVLEATKAGQSHRALLLQTRQVPEDSTDAQPFKLSLNDHRERESNRSVRRCSADMRLGYNEQWLTNRILKSSMSANDKRDFRMASPLMGINLSDRSAKLNYIVQLTERGQVYVEIVDK